MTFSTNFANGVFLAERQILYFDNVTSDYVRVEGRAGARPGLLGNQMFSADYYPDANHHVEVDVTDFVRAYAPYLSGNLSNYVRYQEAGGSWSMRTVCNPSGLIDPSKLLIPPHDMDLCEVVPPTYMLDNLDDDDWHIISEAYSSKLVQYEGIGEDVTITPTEKYTHYAKVKICGNNASMAVHYGGQTQGGSWRVCPLRCDVQYALVEWQSSITGKMRQHWFEVVKHKIASDGNYSLLTMDNSYDERKGRLESFSLRLDNLDAYDLWYYADVLLSSKVQVCINGNDYEQVQVTTKNITIPDGEAGTKGEIEITVNFKRYDPAIM